MLFNVYIVVLVGFALNSINIKCYKFLTYSYTELMFAHARSFTNVLAYNVTFSQVIICFIFLFFNLNQNLNFFFYKRHKTKEINFDFSFLNRTHKRLYGTPLENRYIDSQFMFKETEAQ